MTHKKVANYKMNVAERGDDGCKAAEMWYDRKTSCSECPFPVEDCLEGKSPTYIKGYIKCQERNEGVRVAMALAMIKGR